MWILILLLPNLYFSGERSEFANFEEKLPQVHLIIIRKWPKPFLSPYLQKLDNSLASWWVLFNSLYNDAQNSR